MLDPEQSRYMLLYHMTPTMRNLVLSGRQFLVAFPATFGSTIIIGERSGLRGFTQDGRKILSRKWL